MDENGKVRRLILALGGQKAVADALKNTPITTVNSWMMRENIPNWRLKEIFKLVTKKKIPQPLWLSKRIKELG